MPSPASMRNNQRTIFGWAMYDWANSAYITAGSLIFAIYFGDTIFPENGFSAFGISVDAEGFFGILVGVGALILFLAMPILGAIADYSNSKKRLLQAFAYTGAAFAVLTAVPGTGDVGLAVVVALFAQIGFVSANVMYEGFLPELTTPETIDRVSARGFAFGYAGGGIHLVLSLMLLYFAERLGLAETTAQRIVIASAGVWWAGFAAFSFTRLRDAGTARPIPTRYRSAPRRFDYARLGIDRTWRTTRQLAGFPQLLLFVVAFLFYNDGVQTVIKITPVFASETLDLSTTTIAAVFVVIQIVAFFGALAFGWLAGRVGAKRAILVSIAGWTLVTVGGYLTPAEQAAPFLLIGVLAGLVLGGVQALSRSLYGSMIPEEASAEFFGFYSVFSRFSSIFGPLIFAAVDIATGSARLSILFLTAFFIIGGTLLSRVDVDAARASRIRWDLNEPAPPRQQRPLNGSP
ncbi:MAG: MFS transporter [Acidimicrobiia bacterium]